MENLPGTLANLSPEQLRDLVSRMTGNYTASVDRPTVQQQQSSGNPLTNTLGALAVKKAASEVGKAFGSNSSLPTSEAANALYNQPGLEATNAAWNAGATEAGGGLANTAEAASPFSFAGSPFSQHMAGELSPLNTLSGAAALYSGYDMANTWGRSDPLSGAARGAAIGTYFAPGIGTAVGAGLGALTGMAKAGKHKDQYARDALRSNLQEIGFLDDKFNVDLADGTKFDIGVDGGPRPYNIDQSDPNKANAVALLNPLGEILTGGNDKLRSDLVGYLGNASTSNAKDPESIRKNILAMYAKNGIGLEQARGKLQDLLNSKGITEAEKQAYEYGLTTLFNGSPSTSGNGSSSSQRKKIRRPIADVPFPDKIPAPPQAPIIEGGPTEAPLPVSVSEFANAYKMAADRLTNNDINNPLARRL